MKDVLASYDGRTCVVTGSASGIGRAVADRLYSAGARVVGVDCKAHEDDVHQFIETDLGDRDSTERAIAAVEGPVDCVFSCAGLSGGASDPQHVLRVNFIGTRAFAAGLLDRVRDGGALAFTSSGAAHAWRPNAATVLELVGTADWDGALSWAAEHDGYVQSRGGYAISKEALILFAMNSVREFADRGLRINAIAPGITDTPMLGDSEKIHDIQGLLKAQPLRRKSSPDEQANVLLFLNSDWASHISGETIWSDGGYRTSENVATFR